MNEHTLTLWAEYIRLIAHQLRLTDWEIGVSEDEELGEEYGACIHHIDGRRLAIIFLGPTFKNETPVEQRNSIIHEILHLQHVMLSDIVEIDLKAHLTKSAHAILFQNYRRQVEYMTDNMTSAIESFFPLPDEANLSYTSQVG